MYHRRVTPFSGNIYSLGAACTAGVSQVFYIIQTLAKRYLHSNQSLLHTMIAMSNKIKHGTYIEVVKVFCVPPAVHGITFLISFG